MKTTVITFATIAAVALGTATAEEGKERKERPTPQEAAQRMIENHDENGDGALDAEELKAAHKAKREAMKEKRKDQRGPRKGRGDGEGRGEGRGDGERPERPTIDEVIEKFDTDGSNSLDESELTTMLEEKRERMRERMQKRRGGGKGKGRGPVGEE